jgi:hypothetical protein
MTLLFERVERVEPVDFKLDFRYGVPFCGDSYPELVSDGSSNFRVLLILMFVLIAIGGRLTKLFGAALISLLLFIISCSNAYFNDPDP